MVNSRPDSRPYRVDLKSERVNLRPERFERAGLRSVKADWWPERAD